MCAPTGDDNRVHRGATQLMQRLLAWGTTREEPCGGGEARKRAKIGQCSIGAERRTIAHVYAVVNP